MTVFEIDQRRDHLMTALVACVTVAAAVLTAALVAIERSHATKSTNWMVFGALGSLLFAAETRPSFTMKVGENGTISPGWTFAYALMLFGMPLEALAVLLAASFTDSALSHKPIRIATFNASVLATSLSSGALVLHAFGIHESMTTKSTIPLLWGIAIVLGAGAMLLLNGLVIAMAIALHTATSFLTVLRTGLAVSMTADGALLSLAPVFVIAIDFSLALVPMLATTSYIVVRSARKSLQRAYDANHDPLTGLLNRRAFRDRLFHVPGSIEVPSGLVLVMDFDRFKDINDSLGHASGDALLVGFSERLVAALPATAAAARLGGDEFAVLIQGEQSIGEARRVVEQLHATLIEPYDIAGFPLTMSVSIGVAKAPEHGHCADELIAAADLAMYRAKHSGHRVEFYESAQSTAAVAPIGVGRVGLLGGLADAIERGHLTNEYQPIIDTMSGRIDTVEALVRWIHPEHGRVMPNDFIDMAEHTDLIDALTDDVLRRAMCDVLSLDTDTTKLAVNVSARSLHQRTFANSVLDAALEIGFPTDRLELEITERAMFSDPDRIQLTLAWLREAGISIAIDDFGTGYSSFGSLRQIRADRLKIDRSFIARIADSPEDRLVVRTITDLGHGLGLAVVVEGIEADRTLEIITSLGCDYAQGFGIARPMSIDKLRQSITAEHRARDVESVT